MPHVLEDFWQLLPRDIQLNVVETLDYKSRCCLQKCSKADRDLVEYCPIKLEYLKLEIGFDNKAKLVFNESFETKEYDTDDVIDDFALIFKNPNSFIENLEIYGFARPNAERIIEKIMRKKRILKTKRIRFWFNKFESDELFVQFVKTLDYKTLESLIMCHQLSRDCFNLLTETKQWKKLKKVGFGEIENPDIDMFLHLKKMRFEVRKISPEDLWKLVTHYLKPLPSGSYFDININHDADVHEILEYFKDQGVIIRNDSVNPRDSEKYIHTQRFEIPMFQEKERVLILKMNNWHIYGWVGRTSRYK